MKNVIITGAANGVGKAVAQIIKNENLILIDIDRENLEKTAKELNKDYYVCDLGDANQISRIIAEVNEQYDKIDCLINCAGMWISGNMSKLEQPLFYEMNTLDRIKDVINTNVFGTIAMIKSIFPIMKKQGYGQIININSQSGVMCEPQFPIYNATKHSTTAFRKAIQDDLARNNIKITDVCPGLIRTDFYKRANNELPKEVMENGLTPEDVAKTVKYVFDLPHEITIPSIEVRHIKNY
jgi:short-subunit dehydrogenase